MKRNTWHLCITLLSIITVVPMWAELSRGAVKVSESKVFDQYKQKTLKKVSTLHIPFIANEGQVDEEVGFYARTFGGTIYVTQKGEVVYSLIKKEKDQTTNWGNKDSKDHKAQVCVLKEYLLQAKKILPKGVGKAKTKINYFIGNNKNRWRTNISSYNNVSLGEVYDHIDLSLRAHGNNVEKIFTVHPKGKVEDIHLGIKGAKSIAVSPEGELVIETDLGPVGFSAPVAYQDIMGKREHVKAAYVVNGATYSFHTGEYDHNYPLLIDPLLASTFIGGSVYDGASYDIGISIALDSSGNVYVAGETESNDYPTTSGAYDETYNASSDVFVSKLTSDLSTLSASTFIGGSANDYGNFLILDSAGNVYVTGWTESSDIPTTSGAYDETYNGLVDAFVFKLSNDLSIFSASTFIGGSNGEYGIYLALDGSGNVYVTGWTESNDCPVTPGTYDETYNGAGDVFVSKLTSDLSTLSASTFIGGSSEEPGYGHGVSIALDSTGNVYVAGETESNDYPTTPGAYDETYNSVAGNRDDVFVSKLTSDLSTLFASTFIGGSDREGAYSIVVDSTENVYVAGRVYSSDYPATPGAYDETHNGSGDVFISKLTSNLSTLSASTFIGGSGNDYGKSLVLDSTGNVYVAGETESNDYPTTPGAYDETHNGSSDVFVSKFTGNLEANSPPQPMEDLSSNGDVSCFIATAAYGSPLQPHVKVLRKFHDRFLIGNAAGRKFVELYNIYSPPMADFIAKHDNLRKVVRVSLLPVVGLIWVALQVGSVFTIALMLLFVIWIFGFVKVRIKFRS